MSTILFSLMLILAIFSIELPSSAHAQIQRETDPFVEEAVEDKRYIQLTDRLAARFGGTLESEVTQGSDFGGETADLPTLQIKPGIEVKYDDWLLLFGAVDFNFEPGDDALLVEELFLGVGNPELSPVLLKGGYYTSPFGDFDTLHDASPLPEGAFELKGDIVELVYVQEDFFLLNAYAVRGRRDWTLKQFSGTGDEPQHQDWRWGVGAQYTTTLAGVAIESSLGLTNSIYGSSELVYSVSDRSGGLGANGRIAIGNENLSVWMQYVSALEPVQIINEVDDGVVPSVPSAFAVEIDVSYDFSDLTAFFAASYSRTWDLETILPQEQVIVTAGIEIKRLQLLIEYGHQWDYRSSASGARPIAQFFTGKAIIGY